MKPRRNLLKDCRRMLAEINKIDGYLSNGDLSQIISLLWALPYMLAI
jgi:hypothetical protein